MKVFKLIYQELYRNREVGKCSWKSRSRWNRLCFGKIRYKLETHLKGGHVNDRTVYSGKNRIARGDLSIS